MGKTSKSLRSKSASRRTVASCRPPPRSHPMILRRVSAQSRSALGSTTASHATPTSDPATAAFDASLTSNPGPTTFDATSLMSDLTTSQPAPVSDPIGASLLADRPDVVFAQEAYDYMRRSTEILQMQTKTLVIFQQKLNSINEDKESLEHDTEQLMAKRATEYQCPLCSDLAWNPHVLPCGHSFCSQCLSQHKANHAQKRSANPNGTGAVIRCPTCDALILRKPQFSHTIQQGVEDVAKYFHRAPPTLRQLEWSY
ncbi:uncharacterized protein C8R40DRAFT_1172479 [Lentinula edodes]|uniref:uncharacterized protein n=1 Tax=Lentinula edodes TaxID=5353 RepID=UPI001E8D0180|nr:uncharacterized protein C8R40DRAFT_1172479 [Lentinula edodes]KAH7873683.1 hypothetical protein C8R40DRAFT_1172479 [Lentinula edodes]